MNKRTQQMTLEKLAVMVVDGFDDVKTDLGNRFNFLKTEVGVLKNDIREVKTDISDIKLRLDNLAPKFEVQDLEKRVTRLERHTGIHK